MKAQLQHPISLGLLALPLTGVLYGIGLVLRGSPLANAGSADSSANDFAATAGSASYQAGWILLLVGTVLLVFGYLALCAQLAVGQSPQGALPGMILTASSITLPVGVFGVFAFGYPAIADRYTAGDTGTSTLLKAIADGALTPYSSVGGLPYLAGTTCFAVSIWVCLQMGRRTPSGVLPAPAGAGVPNSTRRLPTAWSSSAPGCSRPSASCSPRGPAERVNPSPRPPRHANGSIRRTEARPCVS